MYSAFSHRGVLGDPGAVYCKAREIAPQLRGVWVVQDAEQAALLPPDVEHVLLNTLRYRQLTARATYFVNNVNWPGTLTKRPGSIHIHTHQGTRSSTWRPTSSTNPAPATASTCRRCCAAPTAGITAWSPTGTRASVGAGVPVPLRVGADGEPRNDVLVGATPAAGAAVRERLGIPAGHTVLYAPTRREYVRGGHVDRLDLARFAEDLGPEHTLVVRLHPSSPPDPRAGWGSRTCTGAGC